MQRFIYSLLALASLTALMSSCTSDANLRIDEDLTQVLDNPESEYYDLASYIDSMHTHDEYYDVQKHAAQFDSLGAEPTLGNLVTLAEEGTRLIEAADDKVAAWKDSVNFTARVKEAYQSIQQDVNSGLVFDTIVKVSCGRPKIERYSYGYGIQSMKLPVSLEVQEAYKGRVKKVVFSVIATDDDITKDEAVYQWRDMFSIYADPNAYRADLYKKNTYSGTWELDYTLENKVGESYKHYKFYATPLYIELMDGKLVLLSNAVSLKYGHITSLMVKGLLSAEHFPDYYVSDVSEYEYMQNNLYEVGYGPAKGRWDFIKDEDRVKTTTRFFVKGATR